MPSMPIVLVVDDSPVVRHVLAQRLVAAGFDVRAEASAKGARAVDPATLASLTCAVIDIELPDGAGSDLAAELLRRRPGLSIAFFTAGASAEAIARAGAHGPVFPKPEVDAVLSWVVAHQPPPTK
jgi:DNA-binding NarL/FixJ family response regulator